MEKKDVKNLIDVIKADDLGQVPDNTGSTLLPKIIADKIISQLLEDNVVRRIFPKYTVPTTTRNLTIPVVVQGSNQVRVIGYGDDPTSGNQQAFTTKSIVLTPRLLTAWVEILEDDLETAGMDLAKEIRKSLTANLAEAEERAMLFGVYNSSSGSYINAFNGIYTIASGATCATSPITYTDSDKLSFKIANAKKALGVYGRQAGKLILICSTTFANKLRQEDVVYNQSYRVDSDVLKTGTLPPIYGVKVIETTHLDEKESGEVALLVRTDAFAIGDRKKIFFRSLETEVFKKKLVIAEELDFKAQLLNASDKYEGIVLIHKGS